MNGFSVQDPVSQMVYDQLQSILDGDVVVAIERVEHFLKKHSNFAQAHNDLGVLYHRSGDLLRSLAHYEKAVRLQPDNPVFRKNLAEFYAIELGWIDDAILILVDLLKDSPNDVGVLSTLAVISIRINQPNEAEIFLGKILALEPWNADARTLLDEIRSGGALQVPVPPVEQKTQPESGSLDSLLQGLRQSIASMTAVGKAPEERYRDALRLAEEGKTSEAITALEEIVRSLPAYALAWNDLGVLAFQSGDLNRSLVAHEQAVRLDPVNPVFGRNLANLYYSALGRTDDAIQIFTGILREQPNDVETLLALGQISAANGCPEQARTFITKVLQIEPWNMAAREFLSSI